MNTYKVEITNTHSLVTFEANIKANSATSAIEKAVVKFPSPLYKNHALL